MARDWSELFITDAPARDAEASRVADAARARIVQAPAREPAKTREALGGEIQATLFGTLDEQAPGNGWRRR